jgi:hypothetical protein
MFELLKEPQDVIGYSSYKNKISDLDQISIFLSSKTTLISNNPELAYFLFGTGAYMWPQAYDSYRMQAREDYEEQLRFASEILDKNGVLLVFGTPDDSELRMLEDLGVVETDRFSGATVFEIVK